MQVFFYLLFVFIVFLNCSPSPETGVNTAETLANSVQEEGLTNLCQGDECCSEHKECRTRCNQVFYKSPNRVRQTCQLLPHNIVERLEEVTIIFKSPIISDLDRLELNQEFRLLLTLDYKVFVRIMSDYKVSTARDILQWFASSPELASELLLLKETQRNDIIYTALERAGGQDITGPVEEGLSQKISFDKSFFQLMVSDGNYDLLQLTHEMIKQKLCSSAQYAGESNVNLCALRIYCKERYRQQGHYVHTEDLRNTMAKNITDPEFFKYVEREILRTTFDITNTEQKIDNQVCSYVCHGENKGCQ